MLAYSWYVVALIDRWRPESPVTETPLFQTSAQAEAFSDSSAPCPSDAACVDSAPASAAGFKESRLVTTPTYFVNVYVWPARALNVICSPAVWGLSSPTAVSDVEVGENCSVEDSATWNPVPVAVDSTWLVCAPTSTPRQRPADGSRPRRPAGRSRSSFRSTAASARATRLPRACGPGR